MISAMESKGCVLFQLPRKHVPKSLISDESSRAWVLNLNSNHDNVIKWKHFPRYWPFVRGIHRSPVNSPHKGQWHGALMFTLICARINGCVNNREAGDLRCVSDIFKCFLLNENVWISIKMSQKFVPEGPINHIPALVQIMAWHRKGDRRLS